MNQHARMPGFHPLPGGGGLSAHLARAADVTALQSHLSAVARHPSTDLRTLVVVPPRTVQRRELLEIVSSPILDGTEIFVVTPLGWRNRYGLLFSAQVERALARVVDAGRDLESAISTAAVLAEPGLLAVIVPPEEIFRARRFLREGLSARAMTASPTDGVGGPARAR